MKEEWRDVVGYEGLYLISNFGRVTSRKIVHEHPTLLKPSCVNGYRQVGLTLNGKTRSKFIHRLVLEAFVGRCPKGMQTAHLDGRRDNNQLYNLKWCTQRENETHKTLHGTKRLGERNKQSKLTEADVLAIRRDYKPKIMTFTDLAKKYGVSKVTVRYAFARKTWKHI